MFYAGAFFVLLFVRYTVGRCSGMLRLARLSFFSGSLRPNRSLSFPSCCSARRHNRPTREGRSMRRGCCRALGHALPGQHPYAVGTPGHGGGGQEAASGGMGILPPCLCRRRDKNKSGFGGFVPRSAFGFGPLIFILCFPVFPKGNWNCPVWLEFGRQRFDPVRDVLNRKYQGKRRHSSHLVLSWRVLRPPLPLLTRQGKRARGSFG